MKKILFVIAALAVLAATDLAHAADMALKAPPPPAPVYSWTGFYVGANAGYGWHDPTVSLTPNDFLIQSQTCAATGSAAGTCPAPNAFNIQGGLGGLQAGYNFQVNQNWVLGLEADFDWSRIKGTGTSNFFMSGFIAPSPTNYQASDDVKWFGTVRGRIGVLPTNNLLLYATGGLAYGRVQENVVVNAQPGAMALPGPAGFSFNCVAAAPCFAGNSARTATGFTVGGGAEYALWKNVSLKAEYLYVNLGSGNAFNVTAQASFGGQPNLSSFSAAYGRTDFHVARAGVNWRF